MSADARSRPLLPLLAPVALLLVLVAAMAAVLVLARRSSEPDVPSRPAPFERPGPAAPYAAFDVQQVQDGRLRLVDGGRDVQPKPDARVEVLRPAGAGDVRPGDWVTVIGIPNEVRNFSIRLLVVLPQPGRPDADGVARSPAGFAGHEVSRDANERPLFGGVVESVEGPRIAGRGPGGAFTLELTPAAPLRRFEAARLSDVRESDRIAVLGSGTPDGAGALLVLPGGAR